MAKKPHVSGPMPSDEPATADDAEKDRHEARNARLLRWLIEATSLAALRGEAVAMARAARNRAMIKIVEYVFWALLVGFAFGAFVTWLATQVGGVWACVIVAGAAAAIALTLHLVERWMSKHRPHLHIANAFPPLAQAMKDGHIDASALGALALAALAGIFLGTRRKSH